MVLLILLSHLILISPILISQFLILLQFVCFQHLQEQKPDGVVNEAVRCVYKLFLQFTFNSI